MDDRRKKENTLCKEAEHLFGGVISMYENMLEDEKDPEAVRFLQNRIVLYQKLLDAYETIIEEHEKMWVGIDLNSSAPLRFGNSKDEVFEKFFSGQAEETYLIDHLLRPRDMKREYVEEEVVFLRKSNGPSLYCDAEIEGTAVEFKLDTGADGIVLSPMLHKNITMRFQRDAQRDLETASGDVYPCFSKMCEVRFGETVLRARVSTFERAQRNLFGMEGINHFDLVVTSESSEGRKLVFGTEKLRTNENDNNEKA